MSAFQPSAGADDDDANQVMSADLADGMPTAGQADVHIKLQGAKFHNNAAPRATNVAGRELTAEA
jgi:hypothetical protein